MAFFAGALTAALYTPVLGFAPIHSFPGDLIVGLVGAFIGDWLLPRLGIHLGVGIIELIVNAFIGAVILLLILRLVGGGRRRWW